MMYRYEIKIQVFQVLKLTSWNLFTKIAIVSNHFISFMSFYYSLREDWSIAKLKPSVGRDYNWSVCFSLDLVGAMEWFLISCRCTQTYHQKKISLVKRITYLLRFFPTLKEKVRETKEMLTGNALYCKCNTLSPQCKYCECGTNILHRREITQIKSHAIIIKLLSKTHNII